MNFHAEFSKNKGKSDAINYVKNQRRREWLRKMALVQKMAINKKLTFFEVSSSNLVKMTRSEVESIARILVLIIGPKL